MLLRQHSLIHGQLHARLPRRLAVLRDDALQLRDEALQVVLNLFVQNVEGGGREVKTKQGLSRGRAWPDVQLLRRRMQRRRARAVLGMQPRSGTPPALGWAAPLLARGWACPPQCTAVPEQRGK